MRSEIPGTALSEGDVSQDFARARSIGKISLGERCLFFQKLLGTSYLPYSQILRAWLRQEEVNARMCCATANFDQFYLVMDCADGRQRRAHMPDKPSGQAALDHIAAHAPETAIGYVRPQR